MCTFDVMAKNIPRIFVFLLIPCLVVDQASATALCQQQPVVLGLTLTKSVHSQACFGEEALTLPETLFPQRPVHPPTTHEVFNEQATLAHAALTPPFTTEPRSFQIGYVWSGVLEAPATVFDLSHWPRSTWKNELATSERFATSIHEALDELDRLGQSLPNGSPLKNRITENFELPDNTRSPLHFRVSTTLRGTTSIRYFNPDQQEAGIVFSRAFYETFVNDPASQWLLMARLLHELSHTNTPSADLSTYRRQERDRILMDLRFLDYVQSDSKHSSSVTRYFHSSKRVDPDDYFQFVHSLLMFTPTERDREIGDYLRNRLLHQATLLNSQQLKRTKNGSLMDLLAELGDVSSIKFLQHEGDVLNKIRAGEHDDYHIADQLGMTAAKVGRTIYGIARKLRVERDRRDRVQKRSIGEKLDPRPIEMLELTDGIMTILKDYGGVRMVGDLTQMTEVDVLGLPGVGRVALNQIKTRLWSKTKKTLRGLGPFDSAA